MKLAWQHKIQCMFAQRLGPLQMEAFIFLHFKREAIQNHFQYIYGLDSSLSIYDHCIFISDNTGVDERQGKLM